MKKEYIILIILIIGLGTYLGVKKDGRIHYDLPIPARVDTQKIDRIEITKDDNTIGFTRAKEGWTLTDSKFPADPSAVDNMLDTINDLRLSALVSEAGDRVRYELDPPNAIRVKAFEGTHEKQNFAIGKTAPSLNHTFVMLDTDKRIFQADKSFRNHFDKSVDDFRNKLIFESDAKKLKKITLEKGGKTTTLVPVSVETKIVWQFEDGTRADQEAASNLTSALSRLECRAFMNQENAQGLNQETALCKIKLENETILDLNLFDQAGSEDMAGTASSSPYAFILASYKAGDILSYVDTLLGFKKTETTQSDQQ